MQQLGGAKAEGQGKYGKAGRLGGASEQSVLLREGLLAARLALHGTARGDEGSCVCCSTGCVCEKVGGVRRVA